MQIIKIIFFAFLLNSYLSSAKKCKGCTQMNELPVQELRILRHEYLKSMILQKLHLTEAPNPVLPKPPEKSVLIIAEMTEDNLLEEENQGKTDSVIIYPREAIITCTLNGVRPCSRFEFQIPESLNKNNFISGEAWLHLRHPPSSLHVEVILGHHTIHSSRYELSDQPTNQSTENWIKYAFPSNVSIVDFIQEDILAFEISGDESVPAVEPVVDGAGDEKPFLIIGLDAAETLSRSRRSITCNDQSSSCCRENFFLNFAEIGWDNWILHPDGYQANFCRGHCFHDLSNTRFYHSAVLLNYIRDNRDIAEEMGLNMCCTPSIMAPVTIIYRNEEGHIFHKIIENMKVESCNCA